MKIFGYNVGKHAAAVIIFLLWAGIYLPGLGMREMQGNEPKRTLPALTMIETGNWITPELAGEKYYKKPPLINWMIATSYALTGKKDEFASRLPSALSVLCFVMLIVLMPSGWLSLEAKFISAVAFLTSFGILDKGRMIEIDAPYAAVTGMAILCWFNFRSLNSSKWLLWTVPGVILGFGLLLKGPLILVFFYCTIIFFLKHEKKLSELRSRHHFAGLAVMIAVFCIWAVTAFLAKPTIQKLASPPPGQDTKMSSEWISDVMDTITGMDKVDIRGWIVNIFQAATYTLPWLLFIPIFRKRKRLEAVPEGLRIYHLALIPAFILGFVLVSMLPGTRARYYVPLISLSAMIAGLVISYISIGGRIASIWRNIILGLALVSAVSLSLGIFLVGMRHIETVYGYFGILPRQALEHISSIPMIMTALFTLGFIIFIFMKRSFLVDSVTLSAAVAFLALVVILQFSMFILPIARQFDVKRPVGTLVNRSVPLGVPLYLFDFGIQYYEPFLYYIRPPVKYIFTDDELPRDGGSYVLFDKESFGRRARDYHIAGRDPRMVAEINYKKRKFVIIKFEKPVPDFQSLPNKG